MDTTVVEARATGKIAAALAKAQAEFKPLHKTKTANVPMKTGGSYQYSYADLSDVLQSVREALAKNEIAILQGVGQGQLVTELIHSSGQSLMSSIPFISAQGGRPQDLGSALTYARRYGVCTALGIVADEDDDGQLAQQAPEENKKPSTTRAAAKAPAPQGKDASVATEAQRKKLWAMMKQALLSEEDMKKTIKERFGKNSSKDLTWIEIQELFKMLDEFIAELKTE